MAESIDPHTAFPNNENVPQEDLNFFAELVVTKRNRLGSSASDKPLVISFIGKNVDGVFTTDWTENKENFGIKSINLRMTSSYVPQVDIVFEDVRGQALFNNFEDSRYKVLFDMPPPIFDLTLKGYYGQSITYRLHLIKQSVSFSNNNSFELYSSFVGMTFAPLADMYVDYLEVVPYLYSNETLSGDDISYLELTEKSKQLSTKIKNVTETDVKYINEIGDKNSDLIAIKDNYITTFIDDLKAVNTSAVNSVYRVDIDPIKKSVVNLSYKYLPKKPSGQRYPEQEIYNTLILEINNKKEFFASNNIKYKILKDIVPFDVINKINNRVDINNNQIDTANYVIVFSIDLSNVDLNIHQAINNNIKDIQKKGDDIKTKINKVSSEILGDGPRMSRIMKIIINDAKKFFVTLKSVVEEAERSRANDNDTSHGDAPKYAFPNFYKEKQVNGQTKRVKAFPDNVTWPEVKFVNSYINAKMKAEGFKIAQRDTGFDPQKNDEYTFLPINPFDTLVYSQSRYDDVDLNNITDIIIRRGMVFLKMSLSILMAGKINKALVKAYAKGEAKNLMAVLKTKEKILDAYIQQIGNTSFKYQTAPVPINTALDSGTLHSITGATNNITYVDNLNLDIKTPSELTAFLGIPTLKESTELNDENLKTINDTLKNGLNNDMGYLCQYNVPFYYDSYYKGGFKNRSDYYVSRAEQILFIGSLRKIFADNPEIFYFKTDSNALSKVNTPDDFLIKIFLFGMSPANGRILLPFEVPFFQLNPGICEIPRFALIIWGYIYSVETTTNINLIINNRQKLDKLPLAFKNQCIKYYNEYTTEFNKYCLNSTGDFKVKLMAVEQSDGEEDVEQAFYESVFVKYFLEIQYINFSNNNIFLNTNETRFNKTDLNGYYDLYFNTLKLELLKIKTDVKKEIIDNRNEVKAKINNADLKTELYYNFKSFVDKWMLNTPDNVDPNGKDGGMFNLDNFLMVDRGFNNIGDEVLLDLAPIYSNITTPDTSLYTLLLNLLSKNNFEFFALPSFINYSDGGVLWNNSNIETVFGTHLRANTTTKPKFICMYVGGSSSQLDVNVGMGNSHDDDSAQFNEITDLKSGDVQAFKVDFGTNTQSFFNGLKLDQLEFKETNESIRILDQIAGSDQNVTQTASNSLYNVYEQRSYTAEFEMLGDVMIQPTMYFDLANVAMFKGTYLILEVNHQITPNNFTSRFKGVRIPKVSKPYVTDYAIYANIDGLDPAILSTNTIGTNSGGGVLNSATIGKSIDFIGRVTTSNLSAKEKALLDVIAYAEGTLLLNSQNGYNVLLGGKLINPYKLDYTLGHLGWAGACGRYQIQRATWLGGSVSDDPAQKGLDNKYFSAANQDLTATSFMRSSFKRYSLNSQNITQTNFVQYIDTIANTWAALPYYKSFGVTPKFKNWKPGDSFYGDKNNATEGHSQSPAKNSIQKLWDVYRQALSYYEGTNVAGVSKSQEYYLNQLRPDVKNKFGQLVSAIESKGLKVIITSSYRGIEKQKTILNSGNPTAAQLGLSPHHYGIAIDLNVARMDGTIFLNASTNKQNWVTSGVIKIANDLGFEWGGDFVGNYDPVHFQILSDGKHISTGPLLTKAIEVYGNINNPKFDGRTISLA